MTGAAPHEGIIVLGTPRSGTTLLRRLLDAHPNIACPGETNLLSACARFLHSESIAEGVDIGVVGGLSYAGFPEDEVLRRLREFAFDFHREHARREGKRRWAEKTAFDAFHLANIERLVGNHADFICVQRHGLDVACSLHELCEKNGGYLSELHEYIKQYSKPLEAFARAWVDLTNALADFAERHKDNAIVVKYEDLAADPEAQMRRVVEFIGEPWTENLVAEALQRKSGVGLGDWKTYGKQQVDTTSIGRWQNLSRATINALGRIVNDTLIRCGYEPVETGEQRSDEEARRRYELGLMLQAAKQQNSD